MEREGGSSYVSEKQSEVKEQQWRPTSSQFSMEQCSYAQMTLNSQLIEHVMMHTFMWQSMDKSIDPPTSRVRFICPKSGMAGVGYVSTFSDYLTMKH